MITVSNLNKSIKGKKVLSDVNLEINQGSIVGLFGENGAGKTTLMKCILGLTGYTGEILLDGKKIDRANSSRLAFATSEHSFFPDITAAEHVEFYRSFFPDFNEKRYHMLMNFFQLPDHRKIKTMSAGQQNQFEVTMALSQGAEYIIMDEPFVGNDVFNREDFYRLLAGMLEPDETLILSTHLIDEVSEFIDRAILIHEGRVIGDIDRYSEEYESRSLKDIMKEFYAYRGERVVEMLEEV